MFAHAYKLASCFTKPVVISERFFDKTVGFACGAFIVINDEGWIITVAHLTDTWFAFQKDRKEIAGFIKDVKNIQDDQKLDDKMKREKIDRLKTKSKWITHHAVWWGREEVEVKDIRPLPEGDLFIGRLDPFDPKSVESYPVFKNPADLSIGTSLCKVGYPFHVIRGTFNEAKNKFEFEPGILPIPLFPIEGIYTRNIMNGKSKDGKYDIKLLETSSPGLRGQSGGPIFDIKGTIWAVQSQTDNYDLGFSPKIQRNGHEVEENQVFNVGLVSRQ